MILVVDDERDIRNLVRLLAERGGYRVTEAASAEDALTVLQDPLVEPQLLLTDIVMPGMSGLGSRRGRTSFDRRCRSSS